MKTNQTSARSVWLSFLMLVLIMLVAVEGYFIYAMHGKLAVIMPTENERFVVADDPVDGGALAQTVPPRVHVESLFRDALDTEWDPFAEMQQMQQEMDRLFAHSFNRLRMAPGFGSRAGEYPFGPEMDLTDEGDHYLVRMNIPGADQSNLQVTLDGRLLTVAGKVDERVEKNEGQVIRMERRSGQFRRSVTLPGPVYSANMQSDFTNGVLTVTIPKNS